MATPKIPQGVAMNLLSLDWSTRERRPACAARAWCEDSARDGLGATPQESSQSETENLVRRCFAVSTARMARLDSFSRLLTPARQAQAIAYAAHSCVSLNFTA